ncbi:MAG: ATP-binding protein [Methanosphaera sp.]|nr:ATP-binding protein [Methanosphaera sp.]
MNDYKIIRESPFTPGTVVNPNDFVGREEIIENILRYVPTVINGKNRNFYIIGTRGMGNSSLSYYLADLLENNYSIIPICISNVGINDLNSLIYHLVKDLLNKIGNKNWAENIVRAFGENIEQIGFMTASLNSLLKAIIWNL